ncbi:ABC transporter permease [candidate division WOR-3 bacterium]|nr:ABC transporter permease [candidate division WOR-3 bacterium]
MHYRYLSKPLKIAMQKLSGNVQAVIGLAIILLFAVVAVFAPFLAPYDPYELDLGQTFSPPSFKHLFGTDEVGRDIFSRVLYGSRVAFAIALLIVCIELSISVPLGLISAYVGGYLDELVMRIMDVIISIPSLLRALVIVALLGPGMRNGILAIGIGYMPMLTRLIRSVTLSIREEPYIEACRALRFGDLRIALGHILPNVVPVLIVQVSLDLGFALIDMAALSFIGLGVQPPMASWGAMLAVGKNYLMHAPWMSIFPGMAIMLLVLGFNLLGIGLEKILNPRGQG